MQTTFIEHLHGGLEADAFLATDQVFGRHANVVENHVSGMRAFLAHLVIPLADRDAWGLGFDDERTYATGALDFPVGTRHHGEDAGVRCVGDEALGAVDHVEITVAHGGGLQGSGVGAGVRLGQAEGAEEIASGQLGQILGSLLVCAVEQDPNGANAVVGADVGAERRGRAAQFEGNVHFLFHGHAKAPKILGNGQAE